MLPDSSLTQEQTEKARQMYNPKTSGYKGFSSSSDTPLTDSLFPKKEIPKVATPDTSHPGRNAMLGTVIPGGSMVVDAAHKIVPAMQKIGSDVAARADKTHEIINSDQNPASKVLQVGGEGAAAVNTAIGEGIHAAVPDGMMESVGEHLAPLVQKAAGTDTGKAVLGWWKGLDPETQKNLAATGHIASLLSQAIGVGASKDVIDPAISATEKALEGSIVPVKDAVVETASKVKAAVAPEPGVAFEKNLNRAFPPNKREMKIGTRIEDAKTVFKDIISNKDSNGVVDDLTGEAKDPKNYTFGDTMAAQENRMPQIYKEYTSKLEGVDKEKFDTSITDTVVTIMEDLEKQIAKENSIPDQKAMQRLVDELGALRDTSPIGMQDYLQKLGQRARSINGSLSQEQIQTANLAGRIKAGLDAAVETAGDTGYNAGRQLYKAHKTMQDAFVRAALKEARATPGLMDKLTTLGLTGEGISFMLTHNPAALITAAGIKGANKFLNFMKSPERALGKIYQISEQAK